MSNNKPHGFCETPHEKCTMNYCDENGCMNRKRNLVGEPIEMINNKQSSVEWLMLQLYEQGLLKGDGNKMDELLGQAKSTHKQEITDSFSKGWVNGDVDINRYEDISEQYYNETFGGNNE